MTRSRPRPAPKGAAGPCRARRRSQSARRPEWVRPFRRIHRALDASLRLIDSSLRTVGVSERRAVRRPVRTSLDLSGATTRLYTASVRLLRAAQELRKANECIARDPRRAGEAPELVALAGERWAAVADCLRLATHNAVTLHVDVLSGLASGDLVPEPDPGRRPRIILAPRPVPVRAFLAARRRPRAADRIASILSRRRRVPRPAAVRVPRRSPTGRAPPLVSMRLL